MHKISSVKRNAALFVIFILSTYLFLSYAGAHVRSDDDNKKKQNKNANITNTRDPKKKPDPKPAPDTDTDTDTDADAPADEDAIKGKLTAAETVLKAAKGALESTADLTSKSGLGESITNNSTFAVADDEATRKLGELGSTLHSVIQLGLMGKLKAKHEALNDTLNKLNDKIKDFPEKEDSKITDEALQKQTQEMRDSLKNQAKLIAASMEVLRDTNNAVQKAGKAIPQNVSDLIGKLIQTKIDIFKNDKEAKSAESLMKELPDKLARFQQGLRLRHDYQSRWDDIVPDVAALSASPVIEQPKNPEQKKDDEAEKGREASDQATKAAAAPGANVADGQRQPSGRPRRAAADTTAAKAAESNPSNSESGHTSDPATRFKDADTKRSEALPKIAAWLTTLAEYASNKAKDINVLLPKVMRDPLTYGGEAHSKAIDIAEEALSLSQVFKAWAALIPYLQQGSDSERLPLSAAEQSGNLLKSLAVQIKIGADSLLDGSAGDYSRFIADQVTLFYFTDVPRLMQILNSSTQLIGGLSDARERAAKERANLNNAEMLLANAQAEVNDAQIEVENLKEHLRQAKADFDLNEKLLRRSNLNLQDLQRDLAKAEDKVTKARTEHTSESEDTIKAQAVKRAEKNRDKAAALVAEAEQQNNEVEQQHDLSKQKYDGVKDEQTGLPNKLEAAKDRLRRAQAIVVEQRAQALLYAQAESEAFAEARDNAPYWFASALATSPDPARRVIMYAFPDTKTVFLRGNPEDMAAVKTVIAKFDRPAPQARMTLWSLQLNGESSREGLFKFNDASRFINKAIRMTRTETEGAITLLRDCINEQVYKVSQSLKINPDLLSPAEKDALKKLDLGQIARYSFYEPDVTYRFGLSNNFSLAAIKANLDRLLLAQKNLPDPASTTTFAESLMVLSLASQDNQRAILNEFEEKIRKRMAYSEFIENGVTPEPQTAPATAQKNANSRQAKPAPHYCHAFIYLWRALGLEEDDLDCLEKQIPLKPNGSRRVTSIQMEVANALERIAFQRALDALYNSTLEVEGSMADSNRIAANLAQLDFEIPQSDEKILALEMEVEKLSKQLGAIPQTPPAAGSSANTGNPAPARSNNKTRTKATTAPRPQPGNTTSTASASEKQGELEAKKEIKEKEVDKLNSQIAENANPEQAAKKKELETQRKAKEKELEDLAEKIETRKNLEDQKDEMGRRLEALKRERAEKIRDRKALTDKQLEASNRLDGSRKTLREQLGIFANAWENKVEFDLSKYLPNVTVLPPDVINIVKALYRRYPISTANARVAAADEMLKQIITAAEDDIDRLFIQPALLSIQEEFNPKKKNNVALGLIERTSVLATNRRLARVDPRASAQVAVGEQQDILQDAIQLSEIYTAISSAGLGSALSVLNSKERKQPPQQIYGITSGNAFQVTPIFDPTGQALRFKFDHVLSNQVREPDETTNPQLSQVQRHTVNTEVQLSNLELREVSRFEVNSKLGIPTRTSGGIPILNNIPYLRDVPLVGWFVRKSGSAAVIQQSVLFAQTTMYPTILDIVELLKGSQFQ